MYNKPKNPDEILAIRESGKMLGTILRSIEQVVEPGMTGLYIDEYVRKELKAMGGEPAFLGYMGFPNSICISVNDVVVHGIPSNIAFKPGDVVGFDFGVVYRGMITDAARTYIIGSTANPEIIKLVADTKKSLDLGIKKVKHNCHVGDISSTIGAFLEELDYGNVRDLVGHGVGHHVHEAPEIPNQGVAEKGPKLTKHMTVAIEPMVTLGDWRVVLDPDGWSVRTRDGSLSAHFEDTILVTEKGAEILTRV